MADERLRYELVASDGASKRFRIISESVAKASLQLKASFELMLGGFVDAAFRAWARRSGEVVCPTSHEPLTGCEGICCPECRAEV